ncbi:MAG: hypothetical protein IT383_14475, partial [Deltaproteobacteria bacterium]|nr:hypothetical protein [Deltaproteobacteria bacterium]
MRRPPSISRRGPSGHDRSCSPIAWLATLALAAPLLGAQDATAQIDCNTGIAFGDEVRTYPAQSTITLKLNWQSFVNQGIPNDRVEEMLDAL